MSKVADNVVRIPCKIDGKFFRYWFEFLKPFHHLTDREMEVITCFVKHRYELSKVIADSEILDKVTMSEDTKSRIREECGMALPHFQLILSKLRKNKIIVDNRINPRYIPNLVEENGSFKLMLLFDFV